MGRQRVHREARSGVVALRVLVQERGRFTIPEEIRRVSKIEPGTLVVVEANRKDPGHIHIRVLQVKDEK
ncbi:MAG: hypothetical protein WCC94_03040 [Candidatus Bathyarchaeia archaeon]